jgi:hypothetical protein
MEIQSTDVPVHPMDTSVTVQAVGDKYLVTSHHRHPDGLHSFSCSALVAKESQDLRALERQALEYARAWIDRLVSRLSD